MKLKESLTKLKGKKLNLIVVAVFTIICVFIGLLCYNYYFALKRAIKEESQGYMMEISKQMETNIVKSINDNFSALSTIELTLSRVKETTYKEFGEITDKLTENWQFYKVMVINEDGEFFDKDGNKIQIGDNSFLQTTIIERKPVLSLSEGIDGKESIVFAIPTDITITQSRTSEKMYALATAYELETFDKILAMDAFDGQGYAHIIHRDGTVVIRSSSDKVFSSGYNLLNSLGSADFVGATIGNVRKDIETGKKGYAEFKLGKHHQYMSYSPIKNDMQAHDWNLLTFVPVEAVNVKSNMMLNITLLISGLIALTFALLVASILILTYRHRQRLEKIAFVDNVTGGNTINFFTEKVRKTLQSDNDNKYALIYTNVEKFKLLNEQFGRNYCDQLLRMLNEAISNDLGSDECCGRLFADNFCIFVKYNGAEELVERVKLWKSAGVKYAEDEMEISFSNFKIAFGVYLIDNKDLPLAHMIDRAKLSLAEASESVFENIKIAYYDESVRRVLVREKQLEDMMESALANNEFVIYLQPKFKTATNKVGGAEALVRWISASEGMIYPDEFIYLFEKNGFIVHLDLFVFELVCKLMRKWLDDGIEPVKISVNCSRVHLKNDKFLSKYVEITERYQIPHHYIEIEFTESIVFGDVDQFISIIRQVHDAGFGCSMDDFGSGYSSLSLIKDVPVDTLKLDKVFFRQRADESSERSESVVASILYMAKALNITTVAEGVEIQEQVQMLTRLKCDLIQGYYFSRPLPVIEFEKLVYDERGN